MTLHLDEMLAAYGSPKVAQENENRRLRTPKVREVDLAPVRIAERGVRRRAADLGE
jgi:hypothetical protein